MPSVYKKLIKDVIVGTPKQYFPPDEDGEGRTIQKDRLIGNLLNGGSKSTGEAFAGVKELIDGLPSTAAKDAAGLVTDLVELSYLKGIRDIRVAGAKEFGEEDAAQVGARIDAQIKEVELSIRDGVASFPRSIGSDIAKRVNDAIKDADDDGQRRRGEAFQAVSTRSVKQMLNEIYEGLLPKKEAGSRAESEYRSSIMPEFRPQGRNPGQQVDTGTEYRVPLGRRNEDFGTEYRVPRNTDIGLTNQRLPTFRDGVDKRDEDNPRKLRGPRRDTDEDNPRKIFRD